MGGDDVGDDARRDAGSSDNERDVDVFFKATLFSRLKPVLADMVAVVGSVDYVCVVEDTVALKARHNTVDYLVDGLESSKA